MICYIPGYSDNILFGGVLLFTYNQKFVKLIISRFIIYKELKGLQNSLKCLKAKYFQHSSLQYC
jgi:hypothetical protein